jgi:hypothetical protein
MTKDDIIRMARESGLHLATDVNWMPIISIEYAEKFAALVRADEREAIAKMVKSLFEDPDDAVLAFIVDAIRARGRA